MTAAQSKAFGERYRNKKVLITGHTGFKGAWLSTWLIKLGATVVGISKDVPTNPAMFDVIGLPSHLIHYTADVRDLVATNRIVTDERPDFLFHLAAQPIVSTSYRDPVETITSNAIGTMNVLEVMRNASHPCIVVLITSDKSYDNVEWVWGYKETDHLGGRDIYSGSKGAAELIIRSYISSFFLDPGNGVRIGIGRAGNVIGGGDWAVDRIVADCMRAWNEGRPVEIRNPASTRPWQHVLEPLSGYLRLGQTLAQSPTLHGEPFNFGPKAEQNGTVIDLLRKLSAHWKHNSETDAVRIVESRPFHEAGLLKLNCDKALFHLDWEPTFEFDETIRLVSEWYRSYYRREGDMYALTLDQIAFYESLAAERGRVWAK